METNEKKLMPLIERIKQRNQDIKTGKEYSKIMQKLRVEVL